MMHKHKSYKINMCSGNQMNLRAHLSLALTDMSGPPPVQTDVLSWFVTGQPFIYDGEDLILTLSLFTPGITSVRGDPIISGQL